MEEVEGMTFQWRSFHRILGKSEKKTRILEPHMQELMLKLKRQACEEDSEGKVKGYAEI
jgi:hypothetical protein